VTVSAKTQRDAIFRRAVEMAATCAEDQTNKLGGQPAGKFVSGLAVDLGTPPPLSPFVRTIVPCSLRTLSVPSEHSIRSALSPSTPRRLDFCLQAHPLPPPLESCHCFSRCKDALSPCKDLKL